METVFNLVYSYILAKARALKWYAIGVGVVLTFYAGYHTRTILFEAAESRGAEKAIEGGAKIITNTQKITKAINENKDSCLHIAIPLTINEQLREHN